MAHFPSNFLWGAATSAHQVEGNNLHNDWWEYEKTAHLRELSGNACGHYRLYPEDFQLAASLNHNAHRFSIEWSRIQPKAEEFSEAELQHYRQVILCLRENHLEPVVTLHHFTNPLWFAKQGGWQAREATDYFLRFVEKVVEALGDQVNYWLTINEPLVYLYHSYILGLWPPQKKSLFLAARVQENLATAHIGAYRLIHQIYRKKKLRAPKVSIAQSLQAFLPCSPTLKNKFAVYLRERLFNFSFLDKLKRADTLDFIGINYYTRSLIHVRSLGLRHLLLDTCDNPAHKLKQNSLGWDIYPQGLYNLALRLKKYRLPLMVTENGICTGDDALRWEFIREHLGYLYRAMQEGVEVLGYLYWSLLDNFEWDKGFSPRFGLIEVDYQSQKRYVRESARKFAQVAKTGILNYAAAE